MYTTFIFQLVKMGLSFYFIYYQAGYKVDSIKCSGLHMWIEAFEY